MSYNYHVFITYLNNKDKEVFFLLCNIAEIHLFHEEDLSMLVHFYLILDIHVSSLVMDDVIP